MADDKKKSADISIRATFAILHGAFMAMNLPLLYFVFPELVRNHTSLFLFILLPVISFITSVFLDWLLQYIYCNSVDISKIFTASSISPAFTLGLSALSYFLPFLRLPVSDLITQTPEDNPEEIAFTKDIWGYSFYLFWAGVYGQTVGSGLVGSCS